jgi:cytoskeleton protein RodZ
VRDADRSVLFTRLMKTGESYSVPERPGVSMRIGNAGGLEITVDGKTAPALGPAGAVRRDVALDPEKLMAGTAVRE